MERGRQGGRLTSEGLKLLPFAEGVCKEYHKLQLAAQAAMVSGKKDDETMQRLQKIGELLQLNQDASAFLFAEYRLNRVVSDIYKIIAEAIDVDLGALEE